MRQADLDDLAGFISYPSLQCEGALQRKGEEEGAYILREEIFGWQQNIECLDGGTIKLRYDEETDSLDFRYYRPSGEYDSHATLTRSSELDLPTR